MTTQLFLRLYILLFGRQHALIILKSFCKILNATTISVIEDHRPAQARLITVLHPHHDHLHLTTQDCFGKQTILGFIIIAHRLSLIIISANSIFKVEYMSPFNVMYSLCTCMGSWKNLWPNPLLDVSNKYD